jgi:hypothetical protein
MVVGLGDSTGPPWGFNSVAGHLLVTYAIPLTGEWSLPVH